MSEYWHETSPKHHAWAAGDVVRLGSYPFADAVILGFNDDGYARAARPYVYASGAGTTCATALTGVEIIDMLNLTHPDYTKHQWPGQCVTRQGFTKVCSGRTT